MSGYSHKSLKDKLGIKDEFKIALVNPTTNYLNEIPELSVRNKIDSQQKEFDFIHIFAKYQKELIRIVEKVLPKLKKTGILWISWPKNNSKISKDLTENIIREVCLPLGIVDVKVCAIDNDWSGLKLVYRKENR